MTTHEGLHYHLSTLEEHIARQQMFLSMYQLLLTQREDEKLAMTPDEAAASKIDYLITYDEQRVYELESELLSLGALDDN